MDNLADFVNDFVVESQEGLLQFESDLVALEKAPDDAGRLDSIFRVLHTVKGSSGFLGFDRLRELAHLGENLLGKLRSRELALSTPMTNSLFSLIDVIRSALQVIKQTGAEGGLDDAKLKSDLLLHCGSGAPMDALPAPSAMPTPIRPEPPAPESIRADAAPRDASSPSSPTLGRVPLPPETPPPIPAAESEPREPLALAPTGEPVSDSSPSPAKTGLSSTSIRVDVDLLDQLMNLVGELVLTRNRILQISAASRDVELQHVIQQLNMITSELQDGAMKTRMQAIGTMWQKIPRIVRDVAGQCGKKVQLDLEGAETELDKSLIESLNDPMLHLVRNAIDHGIESPGNRKAKGKPEQGTLLLRAFHEAGQVIIEVSDDGAGLNVEQIRKIAVQRGLISFDQSISMTAEEVQASIFLPGFSTADRITNVSGRGVGLDVVKTNIELIGGTVQLKNREGQGTTVRITVPLTLAIIPALMVMCGGECYAIPQVNVVELLYVAGETAEARIERLHDASVLHLRGKVLPAVRLGDVLELDAPDSPGENARVQVAVLQSGERQFALIVDAIANAQEIVVKPLSQGLKELGVYAGSTVTGDGGIALILDVLGLRRRAEIFAGEEARAAVKPAPVVTGLSEFRSLLICEVGRGRRIGIPVERMTRICEIPSSTIEWSKNREVVQYRGEIMPLFRVGRLLGMEPPAVVPDPLPVVVYRQGERSVGLVVERVLDIADVAADRVEKTGSSPVLATEVVLGRTTDLVDVDSLLRGARRRRRTNATH